MRLGVRITALALLALAIIAVVVLKSRSDRGATSSDTFVSVDSVVPAETEPPDPPAADGRTVAATAAASDGRPRLVDLGSDKCIPCRTMAPILEDLARVYADVMNVEVIDVRQDRAAAGRYGIRVIPTQIFYGADGRELYRHQGFYSREEILAKWRELGVALPER